MAVDVDNGDRGRRRKTLARKIAWDRRRHDGVREVMTRRNSAGGARWAWRLVGGRHDAVLPKLTRCQTDYTDDSIASDDLFSSQWS